MILARTAFASALLATSALLFAVQQTTAPATTQGIVLPDGPLKITITGVEGIVQARKSSDQKWQRVEVGQTFDEGAELRTSNRSAVRFSIGDSQIVTLDRLGVVQILRANFENGKFITDLGMKFGRTRYDIEGAGREYDAKVHSPNSVLAVRGTRVILTDQAPFAPEAVSLTGRAMFRDVRKSVAVGSKGGSKAKVNEGAASSANYSLNQTRIDPRSEFSGRTEGEKLLQLSLAVSSGTDYSNLGVLAFLDAARTGQFTGSLVGVLPVGKQLEFDLTWFGSTGSQINLSVTSPLGELVSPTNLVVNSGGQHSGASVADQGVGFQTVIWPVQYPPGVYSVSADYIGGGIENTIIQVTEDKNSDNGRIVTTEQPKIDQRNSKFTFTVDPQAQGPLSLQKHPAPLQSSSPVMGPQRPAAAGPRRMK